MQTSSIYTNIQQARAAGRKLFAVLIDPDKVALDQLSGLAVKAAACHVDYFFIGGSLITEDRLEACLLSLKRHCNIPTVLFPGSILQINGKADGILLLSLLSGRNPDLLIGQHVVAAPYLRASGLEIMSTAYLLIDGGRPTTATYMSHTLPIPADKPDITASTAMAGEMLGFKLVYLDAGSGAQNRVSAATIRAVREAVELPIIVGGGIRTPDAARQSLEAGADLIVIGSAIEKEPGLMESFAGVIHSQQIKRNSV
jgi:putative glycerol-1-phosphate prenyltransferase